MNSQKRISIPHERGRIWKMATCTDEDKMRNFEFIVDTISHIRNKQRITEDWMYMHRKRIQVYRDYFGDFNLLNLDCNDRSFRATASDTEMILNHLIWEIRETGYFTVEMYLKLNVNIKQMFEFIHEVDELSDLLENGLNF